MNNQLLKDAKIFCKGKKGEQKENVNLSFHLNANVKTSKQIQVMLGR